jgi:hypothetical protein
LQSQSCLLAKNRFSVNGLAVVHGRLDIVGFPKQEATMEITFTGMDETDLEQQIWTWRTNNPNLKMTKKHPIEILPLRLSTPHSGQKIFAGHQVSLRVEYDEV